MSGNQFDSLMGAIRSLIFKVDRIEGRLDNIQRELKRIEGWTPYNANQDISDKIAEITSHK